MSSNVYWALIVCQAGFKVLLHGFSHIISTTIICVKNNLCLIVEKTEAQTNSVASDYTANKWQSQEGNLDSLTLEIMFLKHYVLFLSCVFSEILVKWE